MSVPGGDAAATGAPARRGFFSWKVLPGLAISAVALWWVFHDQDFGDLLRVVRSARPLPFAIGAFIATAVFWIRAWRWKALVDTVRRGTSFRSRFGATTIGFMGNNVFGWRVGELMRPLALSRAESLPLSASITTLRLERLLDAGTVLCLLFLSMSLPGLPGPVGSEAFAARIQSVGTALLVALVLLVGIIAWPAVPAAIGRFVVARLPVRFRDRAAASTDAVLGAIAGLRSPAIVFRALAWSFVLWVVNAAGFWFAMRAFGLTYSLTAALFFQAILVIAVSVPSAPGFFGVYEAAAALVLVNLWGADPTTCNAFAAAYHIAGYIPVTVIGLVYAHRIGVSPRPGGSARSP